MMKRNQRKSKNLLRGIFMLAIGMALIAWAPKPAIAHGDIWESVADAPANVWKGGSLCKSGDSEYIYAFRGYCTADFWRYSISGNLWESMADAPSTVYYGGSLCYGGDDYIYAFLADVEWLARYSISGNSWELMAAPGYPHIGADLCYPGSGDYIYAFLGLWYDHLFYRYSISGNSWESLASTPAGIGHGASLCYPGSGDYIYAFRGGYPVSPDFWRYSISNNSWESMANTPADVRDGASLCYPGSGDYIYAFRGGYPVSPDFWRYTISGNSWESMADAPSGVSYGGSLCYPGIGNHIYAFRGDETTDFWRYELPEIIGDFNFDGYVDGADLLLFGDHWHFIETDPGWDPLYDLVPDGIIDAADLQVFGDHWHEGAPPRSETSGKFVKGSNENAGIRFDLDATTYGNQNDTIMTTPDVGDYIRVDVYAINVHNLDTYEFEVNYDPTELAYVTATATSPITFEGNILESNGGTALGWMVDTSTPSVLSIAYTLAYADTNEAPEGEGLIADIVFQVLSTTGDSLTFGDVCFYDSFGVMDIITDKGIAIITPLPYDYFDISGNIGYFSDDSPVPNADVDLTGDDIYSTTTNTGGDYLFNDIPGGNYISTPSKADDLGGLSGTDASRIARYVALLYEFDCIEMITADVSMNGNISGTDASRVARYVALLITELNPDGINWVFTPEPIPECEDWPPIVYESTREYSPLDSDLTDEDFIGIRLGDVSGNWSPDSRVTLSSESFVSTEIEINTNSILRIPVVIDNVTAIEGIDISIAFNKEVLHLSGLTLGGILAENDYAVESNLKDGKIVIYAQKELVSGAGVFAFMDFDVIGEVGSSSEVYFTKFDVNEKNVTGGLQIANSEGAELVTRRLEVNVIQPIPDKFDKLALYPNYPNPFRGSTTIEYAIKGRLKAEPVEIRIYNVVGQLVDIIEGKYGTAEFDAGNFPMGIYLYQLKIDNYNEVKKMLLIR